MVIYFITYLDMMTYYLAEDDLIMKGKFSFGKDNMCVYKK